MNERVRRDLRVMVTAGGSGIGLAISKCFLRHGHSVHICDVDSNALDNALFESSGLSGTLADVGDPASVDTMFNEGIKILGGVDVLVNNAGIGGGRAPIDKVTDEDWNETIKVNLSGAFYCTRHAARIMKAQLHGCIINISSASARTGLPERMPYVVSKAGLQGLTRNVARELGPYNISCNAILPGAIDNERGHALIKRRASEQGISIDEAEAERLRYISMRTRIDPSEIGEVCVFLATHGQHISGQEIGVCGNSEWEM